MATLSAALAACGSTGGSTTGADTDGAAAVEETADAFLADMSAGAWHAAFSRLHPQLQAECGSSEQLESVVVQADERPESWTLRAPKAGDHSASITGAVQTVGGRSSIVEMTLDRVDADWQIWAWSAGNRELCRPDAG